MKHTLRSIIIIGIIALSACTKTIQDDTDNPFNDVLVITPQDSLDPNSLKGLHRNIFALKCANPNCHDGSFEPDFRTIESTYQTLVYQEVIKNDTLNSYDFRVVPNNIEESWLIERLKTNDPALGRMPLYAVPLGFNEMENIRTWINNGAPDASGMISVYPNLVPKVKYFVAYDSTGARIDTARVSGWASPFKISSNTEFTIYTALSDDSTSIDQLLVNKMYFSNDKYDFTNATAVNATFHNGERWKVTLPTNTFPMNQVIYFRYEVGDPDHPSTITHPNDNSSNWYMENASFIIQ